MWRSCLLAGQIPLWARGVIVSKIERFKDIVGLPYRRLRAYGEEVEAERRSHAMGEIVLYGLGAIAGFYALATAGVLIVGRIRGGRMEAKIDY